MYICRIILLIGNTICSRRHELKRSWIQWALVSAWRCSNGSSDQTWTLGAPLDASVGWGSQLVTSLTYQYVLSHYRANVRTCLFRNSLWLTFEFKEFINNHGTKSIDPQAYMGPQIRFIINSPVFQYYKRMKLRFSLSEIHHVNVKCVRKSAI